LNTDSFNNLLIGEGTEKFPCDDFGCSRRIGSKVADYDIAREYQGDSSGDDEGEEDL
jgi:hypothetical protein